MLALQKALDKTIIFVSHDLDEAVKLGNRIAIMQAGRIIQSGTPREIIRAPATGYVADFVATINRYRFLTAEDIMQPVIDREQLAVRLAATVRPRTTVAELLRVFSQRPETIGVIDRGRVVGTVSIRDVINNLAPRPPQQENTER
nr:CBS domain-containing protein [Marinicella sp. W31]MDC2878459.1 CBS domain-containing protein [Marinicella sp. W31]